MILDAHVVNIGSAGTMSHRTRIYLRDATGLGFDLPYHLVCRFKRFKRDNPDFDDFRFEGQCPSCRVYALISYTMDIFSRNEYEESCGDYCLACKFSGATYRYVIAD